MLPSHRKAFETLFNTYGYVGMLKLIAERADELGCQTVVAAIDECVDKIVYKLAYKEEDK